jgi:hypothetical protein
MNSKTRTRIILPALLAALSIPVQLAAQDKPDHHNGKRQSLIHSQTRALIWENGVMKDIQPDSCSSSGSQTLATFHGGIEEQRLHLIALSAGIIDG